MKKPVLGAVFLGSLFAMVNQQETKIYAQEQSALENFKVNEHYQADSDGDGIIDLYDKNPSKWDVSDRDLRFFTELSYRSQEELIQIFDGNESTIQQFNQDKLLQMADVRELTKHWQFILQMNESEGFSASFFTNGSKVVVAFRGTDGASDIDDDLALITRQPGQVKHLKTVLQTIQNYDEYYLTDHSLRGYLAEYMAVRHLMQDEKFIHSAIFNAPGITASWTSNLEHRQTARNKDELVKERYTYDADARQSLEEFRAQPYSIHGDTTAGLNYYANTTWLSQVNSGSKHSSTNFVATRPDNDLRKYFSVGYRLDRPFLTLDADQDNLLDVDELKIGTDIHKSDTDGDGFSDYIELALGHDPLSKEETPSFNQIYQSLPTKALYVETAAEMSEAKLREVVFTGQKSEFIDLTKHYLGHSNQEVRYEFLNLPKDWRKVPPVYPVQVLATYKDGSKAPVFHVNVRIAENANNQMADYLDIEVVPLTVYQGDTIDLLAQILGAT